MLRDVLTRLPGVGTWPCDEINSIWRYGNALHPLDELEPALATRRVRTYIRRAFDRVAQAGGLGWVVEKTCANSLRVAFVDRVVPNAKYVFLVRDGRDVSVSAVKRWKAPLDLSYLLRKVRFVPPLDVPFYGLRYVTNRLYRLTSREKRLACWGPRFDGMENMLATRSLAEVCAAQWARCVRIANYELSRIDAERVCTVQYERFVAQPKDEVRRLLTFLELDAEEQNLNRLVADVSRKSVGSWRQQLSRQTIQQIEPLMIRELESFGYESAAAMQAAARICLSADQADDGLRKAA